MARDGMFTATDLLERGWTRTAIRRFLGEPDERREISFPYRHQVTLYCQSRVLVVETSDEWQEWRRRSAARCQAARKAADRKRQETLRWVESLDIQVPRLPRRELERMANEYPQERALELGHEIPDWAPLDSPAGQRWAVNFLRHEMSPYEALLCQLWGRVGVNEAGLRLFRRIVDAIGNAYPDPASECERQYDERVRERT